MSWIEDTLISNDSTAFNQPKPSSSLGPNPISTSTAVNTDPSITPPDSAVTLPSSSPAPALLSSIQNRSVEWVSTMPSIIANSSSSPTTSTYRRSPSRNSIVLVGGSNSSSNGSNKTSTSNASTQLRKCGQDPSLDCHQRLCPDCHRAKASQQPTTHERTTTNSQPHAFRENPL